MRPSLFSIIYFTLFASMKAWSADETTVIDFDRHPSYQTFSVNNPVRNLEGSAFQFLPKDAIEEIFHYIDFKTLALLSKTCQFFHINKIIVDTKLNFFLGMYDVKGGYEHDPWKGPSGMIKALDRVFSLNTYQGYFKLLSLSGSIDDNTLKFLETANKYRFSPYFIKKGGNDLVKHFATLLKVDISEPFSLKDWWFSIKRDPYYLTFLRVAVNTLIIVPLIVGGKLIDDSTYKKSLAYYSSPDLQANSSKCYFLCGNSCYVTNTTLDYNSPPPTTPNMNHELLTLQNQCNLTDVLADEIVNFFNQRLQHITGRFWNTTSFPINFNYQDVECSGYGGNIVKSEISNIYHTNLYGPRPRYMGIEMSISHFEPKCSATSSFEGKFLPAILGPFILILINVFLLPHCYF